MNKAAHPSELSLPPADARAATARRPRILVIDDTEDIRFFLSELLRASYDVTTAGSGEEGLQLAIAEQRPELILLDVVMPVMDGYEVMGRLGRDPRTSEIPVIFLTALHSAEEEQRGLDLGADDYITKPISPPILLARVRLHLERSANARRLKDLSVQLSRYLAPQVYQSLFDGSRQAQIQTQRKRLTVFFSDIKNFTASTAQWQPEEVTLLLNNYFAEMSLIAAEYGATLDKFIGDAIVIFFGDPHTLGPREDALQCVRMALAMQRRMDELQLRWREMGINKGFEIRVGINTGYCDVGNFGSELRMDYTIIGREVNLAARLEQAAGPGEVLISRETWGLVQDEFEVDAREPVVAKGFAEPIPVYALRQPGATDAPEGSVISCKRPWMRLEIDAASLTAAQRADAAAELRRALETLQPAGAAGPSAASGPATKPAVPLTAAPAGAEGAPSIVLANIPGLDTSVGLSRAMNMQPLYLSLLRRFLDNRRDVPARIRDAIDAADAKNAELLAHSLRGVSAQIGALRVPDDAGALETALANGSTSDAVDGLLRRLEDSLAELIGGLALALPAAEAKA
jgi:adenylate cyclase